MFTLFALTLVCLAGVAAVSVVAALVLTLIGLPLAILAILFSLLPWLLRLAGIVLLVKGLLDRPFQPENLLPAVGAFAASWLLKWLF